MIDLLGGWVVMAIASTAYLMIEAWVADLGPTYDENYLPCQ